MKLKNVFGRLAARSVRAAASVVAGSAVVAPLAASAAVDYTGTDYAPWSYSAGCVVWRATEGTFHTSTVADVASDGTIGTAYAMTSDHSDTSWHRFASNQTGYSAPGMVLVYDESGYTAASDAQFTPLSVGGMWVKALADETTTYSIVGSSSNERLTELGGNDVTPYFKFDKSFTIDRSSETKIISNNHNPVIFDIAEGATFTNTSRLNIVGGATLKLTGKGTLAVPAGLDIQGGNQPTALDISSADCPVIDGDVTATGTGAMFLLPAGIEFDTDLDIQVCTGTLTATAGKVMVMIGSTIDSNVYITTSGGKITRLSKTVDYYVSVTEDAQWDTASWSPSVPTGNLDGGSVVINIAEGKTLSLPESLQNAVVHVSGGTLVNAAETVTTLTDVTIHGVINASGTVKAAGTTVLDGANVFNYGSTFEVVSGTTSLSAAGQSLKGVVTIDADATLCALSGDAYPYNAGAGEPAKLNIYGTLDMGSRRWTMGPNNPITLYTGGTIQGSGDGTAAIDFNIASGAHLTVSKAGEEESGTATITAPIQSNRGPNAVITVDEGMTLNANAIVKGGYQITKNGAGTFRVGVGPNGYQLPKCTEGIIEFTTGTWAWGAARDVAGYVASGDASITLTQTFEEYATGLTEVTGTPNTTVVVNKFDNTSASITFSNEGQGTLSEAPVLSGNIVCWHDYEFNNNWTDSGKSVVDAKTWNGNEPNFVQDDRAGKSDNYYVYTSIRPGPANGFSYPTEWSAAIRCTVPQENNAIVVMFGNSNGDMIGLASGAAAGQVKIVTANTTKQHQEIASMAIASPTTSQHVFVFTKTADYVTVYCDGKFVKRTPASITPGSGFQFGTMYSGYKSSSGLVATTDKATGGTVDYMRLYDRVIPESVIKALAAEEPFVSDTPVYGRSVAETADWVVDNSWIKSDDSTMSAAPAVNGQVVLTATANTSVTVNLTEAPVYETLTFGGEGDITLVAGEGSQPIGAVSIKVNTNVTVPYNLVRFDGADVAVADGKTLTIDYTGLDWSSISASTAIAVTGAISSKPADGAIVVRLPETHPAFVDSAVFRYDDVMSAYIIDVAMDHAVGAEIYWDASNGQTYWGDGNNAAKFYASYANGVFSNETLYRAGDTVVVPDTTQRWYGPLSDGAKIKFDCGGTIDVSKTDSIGYVFKNTAVTVAEGTTLNFTKSGNADPVVYGGSVKGAGKIAVGDGVTLTVTSADNNTFVATEVECTGTGNVIVAKDEKLGAGETLTLKSGAMTVGSRNDAKWLIITGAGGTVNLDGGVLSVCRFTANAAMNVNFNGGTLKSYGAGGSWGTIIGDNQTINLKVLEGGAIIDTDVYSTSITAALTSGVTEGPDGGLVKKGTGTLTLTVAPTFTGAISVEAGALVLPIQEESARTYTLAEGTEVVASDDTTMTLGSFATLTVPVVEGLSATVTVDGVAVEGVDGENVKAYAIRTGKTAVITYAAVDPAKSVSGTATYTVENMIVSQTLVVDVAAGDSIAKIGDAYYGSLKAAIDAANAHAGNYTITLLQSVEVGTDGLAVQCGGGRNITIVHEDGVKVSGSGTITKTGSGMLTFRGDMSEYTGIVTVSAGTVFVDNGITLNPQQVVVAGGEFKVGSATVNMVNTQQAMDFNLNAGSLTMEDGSFLTVGRAPHADAKWLVVAAGTAINLNGGELAVCRLAKWANVAAATVNFNGGTLKSYGVGNSVDSIISAEENSPWTLNVLAGGAIVDTDVDTTISDALISGVEDDTETEQVETDGGLVKKGTGALTLAAAPTFTGAVSVEAGALYVPTGATLNLATGTVKADTSDKEGYDKYVPGQSGTQCEDGSGNNFTVPTTVVVPNEKTLADATGKGTTYAQAYALGLWDGTAEDEVDDLPEATISIADGVVTVTFTGVSSEAYTIKKWLQEKSSLTAAWPETPTEDNSTLIEGDSATDVIGSGEDAQFYRVVVTIEDK